MRRVLVVDDQLGVRESIRMFLTRRGFRVDCADSGRAAQRMVALNDYDLVITDVFMADGDGIDLAQFMQDRRMMTPLISMSGGSANFAADKALRSIAPYTASMLEKPFQNRDLLDVVHKSLSFDVSYLE
jgi:two-component system, chemotaxis family, chemotaxis protein CheY